MGFSYFLVFVLDFLSDSATTVAHERIRCEAGKSKAPRASNRGHLTFGASDGNDSGVEQIQQTPQHQHGVVGEWVSVSVMTFWRRIFKRVTCVRPPVLSAE